MIVMQWNPKGHFYDFLAKPLSDEYSCGIIEAEQNN